MALISTVSYGLLTLLGFSIRPDTRPTEGAVGSTCIGLYVRNGSVSCSNDGSETVCEVVCGGRQRGKFTCTEEKGWIPNLPTCAKTIKVLSRFTSGNGFLSMNPCC
ncbi:unnamed protein product [Larinioides sclopetarius]|uniref:Sushi domain-containing protein n=1 Tax=Larinioides sclopetarius TaxID=280406 RepID=A0AAV1ZB19_9ARAC